jgi:tetratricopeptide (TPR) repeat protein
MPRGTAIFRIRRPTFLQANMDTEAGRTMVGEMDNLSFLSCFEDAVRLEQLARPLWKSSGWPLPDNSGNRTWKSPLPALYDKSLLHYESALAKSDSPVATVAAGMGRAHVLTDMNRFDEAMAAFESTKDYCGQHGLALWADIADRGISRMHFLRGNYSVALRMIEQLRRRHDSANDKTRGILRSGSSRNLSSVEFI